MPVSELEFKEQFLKDVENHTMEIFHDEGKCRHLVFSNNGSLNQMFEIVTWNGYLTICGDMGTYTFKRTADMFKFFRDPDLGINPSYYGEKLVAIDKVNGFTSWSPERFERNVWDQFDALTEENYTAQQIAELRRRIEVDVIAHKEDEREAMQLVTDFEYEGFTFQDFWELDNTSYTHHYLWILFAIVWGIDQYDNRDENDKN